MQRQSIEINRDLFESRMSAFHFRLASAEDILPTLKLGEQLLATKLTTPEIVRAIHVRTNLTVWVTGEPQIDGFAFAIPLSDAGEVAMRTGEFTPANPSLEHVWQPGERCFGFYCWVYGGATRDARRSVMQAAAILRIELFGAVPAFARGATDDGVRSMQSLGMTPLPGGVPDLWVSEALFSQKVAA